MASQVGGSGVRHYRIRTEPTTFIALEKEAIKKRGLARLRPQRYAFIRQIMGEEMGEI
jgi:hypothetical protein